VRSRKLFSDAHLMPVRCASENYLRTRIQIRGHPAVTLADVIDLDTAAKLAGKSTVAMARAARAGRLPAAQLGSGAWVTTREAALAYRSPPAGRPRKSTAAA
jgi:hypothetical protein